MSMYVPIHETLGYNNPRIRISIISMSPSDYFSHEEMRFRDYVTCPDYKVGSRAEIRI